ncbi:Nucleoporin [Escovopsis weberi]|uniref:Nuclear pore complex protein n=1 Tax=Escovopsis weberi TaxID=150374 RepID=A0A0M9VVK2_ESCWE|nr:Nucleoporin [Escovopsis weberi]
MEGDRADLEDFVDVVVAGPEVEEFANALDNCLSPFLTPEEKKARILDLPRKFYENANRRLMLARPKRRSNDDVDMDMDELEAADGEGSHSETEETRRLDKEVQTWDLVRRLLPLRHNVSSGTSVATTEPPTSGPLSELLETNTVAQERHAVLQWLQSNAAAGPDVDDMARELLKKADRGDIIAHGWLHSRSAIKLRKGMTAWPHLLDRQQPSIMHSHLTTDGAPLVTQLDPDAVTRQGRKLEPADEYFERAIWLGCFEHLRRGSSVEALRDWCQERTEMWRVVSMSAMLFQNDDKALPEDISPPSLALWRRMCFALARQGGSDDYERAAYGILSGDISSVEKVSTRWDDFLFASYNALLRTQLDSYVLGKCAPDVAASLTQSFPSFDAVQFLGEQEGLEKRLVRSLESQEQCRDEAMEPSKALQGAVIANDLGRHLYEQGLTMTEDANAKGPSKLLPNPPVLTFGVAGEKYFHLEQHGGLRLVSHIYILQHLMERFGSPDGSVAKHAANPQWAFAHESIIAAYTDYLRRAGLTELIPLYCSILRAPRQYEVLSWNMIHEEDPQRRLSHLKLVKNSGIDALKFVETQASLFYEGLGSGDEYRRAATAFSIVRDSADESRFRKMIRADFIGEEDEGVIDSKHEHVIRSLEWLLMVDGMWPKVFSMGAKAYKYFLKYTYLNAARNLMARVPFIKVMQSATGHASGAEELEASTLEETETWSQLLEQGGVENVRAEQVLADARNFRQLEALIKSLDSLETVASLMVISLEIPGDREFWTSAAPSIVEVTEVIKPLLCGWLTTAIQGGDEELKEIRTAYLPETLLAYISALHFAGTGLSRDYFLECMELAALVAEEGSDLAGAFAESRRMTELLEAFTASSKALATCTGDKRSAGSGSKRLKSSGWSRDLWAVKRGNGEAGVRN